MTFPSFSPPFYKFRNICQNTIKYTNFDYSKSNFVKMSSFKAKYEKMKTSLKLSAPRDFMNMLKKIKDMIPL
ncbi:hypothetical protein FO497_29855 [Bacillus cereus ATCC 10876]|nr:hypothetical protein AT281_28325 [Bacillus cereus]MDR4132961.1 hypothetical protein [Bacillus cereus ATCC 10876]PEE92927.1 hypothetical protein COM92_20765 [Bacillus cereus]PGN68805.1 hypothetical protein CN967_30450 [Bacillus cereus]